MPLRWNIEQVKDYETACWIENDDDTARIHPLTDALIQGTMFIGLGSITDKNYQKVYTRYEMARFASEAVYTEFDKKKGYFVGRQITLEEVKAHIGLWTNASRLTDAQYRKRLIECISDRAERSLQYAKEDAAKGGE